jgi:HK97 family phage portal protein
MSLWSRVKALITASPVDGRPVWNAGSWLSSLGFRHTVEEAYAGAWQLNDEKCVDWPTSYSPVWACITLIASDFSKLRERYMVRDGNGIWIEASNPAYDPVIRKPNGYQNQVQFKEKWALSKLLYGNTYALIERDARGVVSRLYILDPTLVTPLVTPRGDVFYQLNGDPVGLAPIPDQQGVIVPASEIIHDRYNCLGHPLIGLPPLYAAWTLGNLGLKIQSNSSTFFGNASMPAGVLTAPGVISTETGERIKEAWQNGYTGFNRGKVAVLGDGLKFEQMRMSSVDAQLAEQLNLTAKFICAAFHVPPFKVGFEALPAGQKVEDMNQIYLTDCLQKYVEDYEHCKDEGLAVALGTGIDLDEKVLLRMNPSAHVTMLREAIEGKLMTINEGRYELNFGPVEGGGTILSQQQYYSLTALAKRDAQPDPFAPATSSTESEPAPEEDEAPAEDEQTRAFVNDFLEALR